MIDDDEAGGRREVGSQSSSVSRQSSVVSLRQSSSVVVSRRQSSSVVVSRRQSSSVFVSRRQSSSSVVVSRLQSSSVVVSRVVSRLQSVVFSSHRRRQSLSVFVSVVSHHQSNIHQSNIRSLLSPCVIDCLDDGGRGCRQTLSTTRWCQNLQGLAEFE
jgi:hypothetical protein